MRLFGARAAVGRALTAAAIAALVGLAATPHLHGITSEIPANETRALWVLRSSLASPESIASLIRTARDHGFNTLLVQVRGRGDAYFNGGIEPRASELARRPATFDPLATVLAAARPAGLRVHAWVNVNLISSAADIPLAANHIVHRHPEWLMVPRDLAQELSRVKEESPGYVGKIARWTRTQANVEGLYASPILPEAVDYVDTVVRDLVGRYKVDGVHLDYARYPSDRFDYGRGAIREFREVVRPSLSVDRRRELDGREAADPIVYPDTFQDEWRAFRIARMTALVGRLRNSIKATRPNTLVTVATAPDLMEARDHRLQDWGGWLQQGLVDAVCPMAYTQEPARFAEQIAAARTVAGSRAIWAGIGAYRLPPAQTIENIETARRLGAAGVVLFSYDSLVDPQQATPDYIAVVGRSAFAKPAAPSDGTR
jgi:uncharacterized lipoprotein YddW (UPF0748 family)